MLSGWKPTSVIFIFTYLFTFVKLKWWSSSLESIVLLECCIFSLYSCIWVDFRRIFSCCCCCFCFVLFLFCFAFFFFFFFFFFFYVNGDVLTIENCPDITALKLAYIMCNNMKRARLQTVWTDLDFRTLALCIEIKQRRAHITYVCMKMGYFCICYRLNFTLLTVKLSIMSPAEVWQGVSDT